MHKRLKIGNKEKTLESSQSHWSSQYGIESAAYVTEGY